MLGNARCFCRTDTFSNATRRVFFLVLQNTTLMDSHRAAHSACADSSSWHAKALSMQLPRQPESAASQSAQGKCPRLCPCDTQDNQNLQHRNRRKETGNLNTTSKTTRVCRIAIGTRKVPEVHATCPCDFKDNQNLPHRNRRKESARGPCPCDFQDNQNPQQPSVN